MTDELDRDAPPRTPPGWYPHPTMAETRRYWDGSKWTDHIAPAVPAPGMAPAAEEVNVALETIGWITALFVPIVGFVIGLVIVAKPGKNRGIWIIVLSIAMCFLYYALVLNAQAY